MGMVIHLYRWSLDGWVAKLVYMANRHFAKHKGKHHVAPKPKSVIFLLVRWKQKWDRCYIPSEHWWETPEASAAVGVPLEHSPASLWGQVRLSLHVLCVRSIGPESLYNITARWFSFPTERLLSALHHHSRAPILFPQWYVFIWSCRSFKTTSVVLFTFESSFWRILFFLFYFLYPWYFPGIVMLNQYYTIHAFLEDIWAIK